MSGRPIRRIGLLFVLVAALTAPAVIVGAQSGGLTATVVVDTANVRSGPGTNYAVVGKLPRNAMMNLTGRNAADTWWYGCCANGRNGWISNTVAVANGNTAALPIVTTAAPTPRPSTPPPPTPAPASYPDWKGEYYNDVNLGGAPLLVRNDALISFDWSLGSPAPGVPEDNFSVRWSRGINLAAGSYTFYAYTSDGVRILVDGKQIMNEWHDTSGNPTYMDSVYDLPAGWHNVVVEYYERGGLAYARVWYEKHTGAQ